MNYINIPKNDIALLPTPLYKLDKISKILNCNIYIKRDDLTGIGFGGNKVRKLEYITFDAINKSYTTLLTYGDLQTNHGILTGIVAKKFGLKCILLLGIYEELPNSLSGNILLGSMLDIDIRYLDFSSIVNNPNLSIKEKDSLINEKRKKVTDEIIEEYKSNGELVYTIESGGSSYIGVLGYVNSVKEIIEQTKDKNIQFDYVVCGHGSKGTYSGLLVGSKLFGLNAKVLGINIEEMPEDINDEVLCFSNKVAKENNFDITISKEDINLFCEYVGKGYAIPDDETFSSIELLLREESIITDPVYTGKVFNGLIGLINSGYIKSGSNVLFIHTGGLPGLFNAENVKYLTEKNGLTKIKLYINI